MNFNVQLETPRLILRGLNQDSYHQLFTECKQLEIMSILGWCGFHSWAKQHRRAEVFYSLKHEEDKRKGLMSEALESILDFGKDEMNLRRVEAFIATNNPASFKLVQKFGFQKEAEIKHRCLFGDEVDWDYLYAVLWE